jgi:hypothetical protein
MKIHKKFKFLLVITAIVLAVIFSSQGAVQAAGLTNVSVLLLDGSTPANNISAENTAIDHMTFTFTPATPLAANTAIKILLHVDDFQYSGGTPNNFTTITQAHTTTDITPGTILYAGGDGDHYLLIPVDTASDTPSGAVTVTINGASTMTIKTPVAAGTYTFPITTWDLGDNNTWDNGASDDVALDSGAAAVVVGTNNVNITGTVDPTLTMDLSSNTCDLSTLAIGGISTCHYNTTVSTNAHSGFNAYLKADGTLRNGTSHIADVSGGTITHGTEAYGVATTDSGRAITQINDANSSGTYTVDDCTYILAHGDTVDMSASAITTSDQVFGGSDGPIANDVFTLCHGAAISGITPAGTYNQLVTITVVASF